MPYQEKFRRVTIFLKNFITCLDENCPCGKFFVAKVSHSKIFYRMIRFLQMEFKIEVTIIPHRTHSKI